MIRKVKNWLGIEGVKIKLEVPTNLSKGQDQIKLILQLSSLTDQKIKGIDVSMKEVYERGKGENHRISEYKLAEWKQDRVLSIQKGVTLFVPITLHPNWMYSEIDKWQHKGSIQKFIGGVLKKLNRVGTSYYIEANLNVAKTKLHPYHTLKIEFKE
ncbi:MAG: hypothetical protein GVX78_05960 [Bacteroidetes bacterium]|nr:hypothetical protein [Bacteroidota bacterium]